VVINLHNRLIQTRKRFTEVCIRCLMLHVKLCSLRLSLKRKIVILLHSKQVLVLDDDEVTY
jgi:hypothetical protein